MPKITRGSSSRGGSRGGSPRGGRSAQANRRQSGNQQPAQQPQAQPAAQPITPPSESPSFVGRIGGGLGSLVRGIGGTAAHGFKGTLGRQLGSEFEKEAFGTSGKIGGTIGAGGAIYGLGRLLKAGYDTYSNAKSNSETKKMVTPEEKGYREKTALAVTGGISNFDRRALEVFNGQQDEGWRAGMKSIKPDTYKNLAVQAIKTNDPSALWSEIVLNAKQNGKNVNASKPLYLPQRFSKGGKEYGYAIDASKIKEGGKPRLIPIELGKGVVWDEEAKK